METALAAFVPGPEGFVAQFAGFAEALGNGRELPVTLADARRAIELLTALYASARSGRAMDLPIGRRHPYYKGWLPDPAQ